MRYALAFIVFICVLFPAAAFADIISGTVTRVRGDSVFIYLGGRNVEIRLDDVDLGGKVYKIFEPGMEITARGLFKDTGHTPVFEAKEVIYNTAGFDAEMLLHEDDD